jgi:NADPH2:quinone reductase
MKAIRIERHGGAEVLRLADLPDPTPPAGHVRVRVAAAGVNFIDIYQRSGLYPVPLPAVLGQEGAGTVEAPGEGVAELAAGDRVTWAGPPGGYAEVAILPAERLVVIPAGVADRLAAAVMLQGMTAHYLTTSTFPLRTGDTCLVHAAAGGVGLLLCQMAKRRGAHVIGTCSTPEKAALAREAGADHVILYGREDFEAETRRITDGAGVQVVYDSVGRDTFEKSLGSLARRGMLALFGQSSGPVPAFDPQVLNRKGSLFLTRPSLGHYTASRAELTARAREVLGWVGDGSLRVRIGAEFPLARAAEAHVALESRRTTGKVLLVP